MMQMPFVLILLLGGTLATLANAFPEPQRVVSAFTKPHKIDGSLLDIFAAINYGNVQAVQDLIRDRNVNTMDDNGITALHVAANKGDEKMADLLFNSGADANVQTINGTSALHIAANSGHDKFARVLLKNGANANAVDKHGVSPLQMAAFKNYMNVVDLLLKNEANVNHVDNNGKSVLHWAAPKASDQIANLLIKSGAKNVDVQDNMGKSPLYYAKLSDNTKFAETVLNHFVNDAAPIYTNILLIFSSVLLTMLIHIP